MEKSFCNHLNRPLEFIQNISGSSNNLFNGRSMWKCPDCQAIIYRPNPFTSEENKIGKWRFIQFYKGTSKSVVECSECKGAFEGSIGFNYCPNCGIKMDKGF